MPGGEAGGAHDHSVDCPSLSTSLLYVFPGSGGRLGGEEEGWEGGMWELKRPIAVAYRRAK